MDTAQNSRRPITFRRHLSVSQSDLIEMDKFLAFQVYPLCALSRLYRNHTGGISDTSMQRRNFPLAHSQETRAGLRSWRPIKTTNTQISTSLSVRSKVQAAHHELGVTICRLRSAKTDFFVGLFSTYFH